jgi:carbon storage regulator
VLVLSRKKNEVVNIGDDITVMIVDIRGDKIRLGIEAPRSVEVHRKEVYDAINGITEGKPTWPPQNSNGEPA